MHHDLTRNTLAVFCIVGLLALSLWVLRPFLAATVWSTMLVVATWPWLILLQKTFGGRRAPAVLVMTVGMLLLLVMPLWWAISTITERSDQFLVFGKSLASNGLPALPEWIQHIPFVGEKINTAWTDLIAGGAAGFMDHVAPYAASTGKWVLSQFGGLGGINLTAQLAGTALGVVWALVGGFVVYGVLKMTMGLRLSQEEEFEGADLTIHKISGTPDREVTW